MFLSRYTAYLLILFVNSQMACAEIYQWTDENGNMYFGDRPPVEVRAEKVELKINSYHSVEVMNGDNWAETTRNKKSDGKDVVMYTTSWCGVCKRAKQYFRQNNIPFAEYDVETNAKGKKDYQAMKGTGVPIILVGNKRINGFNAERFNAVYHGK